MYSLRAEVVTALPFVHAAQPGNPARQAGLDGAKQLTVWGRQSVQLPLANDCHAATGWLGSGSFWTEMLS